ncbi:MAG: hypothetical protein Q9166_002145 [cf. Caloplaca sp. 2 TL-2023]
MATQAAAPHHYKFNITMSCTGCSGAVERVLKKLEASSSSLSSLPFPSPSPSPSLSLYLIISKLTQDERLPTGVKEFNVSLDTQTAEIYAEEGLAYETVLEKIKKTGKTVVKGERDGLDVAI